MSSPGEQRNIPKIYIDACRGDIAKAAHAYDAYLDSVLVEIKKQTLDGMAYDESGGLVGVAPPYQENHGKYRAVGGIESPVPAGSQVSCSQAPCEKPLFNDKVSGFITRDSGKRTEFDTGARRDCGEGKGRFDLIPPLPIKRLAQLYERGASKYGDRNWEKGIPLHRYIDSAARHLNDFLSGDRAEDHLTAVVWNCMGYIHTEAMIAAGKLPKTLAENK